MIVSFDEISDDARIWIYQSNKLFFGDPRAGLAKNRSADVPSTLYRGDGGWMGASVPGLVSRRQLS